MIPLFKTHFSIGKSILRLEDVCRIANDNKIDEDNIDHLPDFTD